MAVAAYMYAEMYHAEMNQAEMYHAEMDHAEMCHSEMYHAKMCPAEMYHADGDYFLQPSLLRLFPANNIMDC